MDVTNQNRELLDTLIVISQLGQLKKSTLERASKIAQITGVCFVETKLDKRGTRPTMMIIDDIYKEPSKKQLSAIALYYKRNEMKRDNNSRENHKRGLEKRIANYATQHTIRTMQNSPAKVHLAIKQAFYGNVLKMLKLA